MYMSKCIAAAILAFAGVNAGVVPAGPPANFPKGPVANGPVINGTIGQAPTGSKPVRCGADVGSCAAGECCSEYGFCGVGPKYCVAPYCQLCYSDSCDASMTPEGPSTISVPRPHIGHVPYGWVQGCTVPNTVALTFDDGPSPYTNHILDLFAKHNAKATFFVNGATRSRRIEDPTSINPAILQRMFTEGHQIGSHTWSHRHLNEISAEEREHEMIKNEMAIRNVIGHIPTYMRPPYSLCTGACETQLSDLGYHIAGWDLDTEDYNNANFKDIHKSKERFSAALEKKNGAPILSISHDIIEPTAMELVPVMLEELDKAGYRAVTMGECLGDDFGGWYREI